jgi:starch phosphorylase
MPEALERWPLSLLGTMLPRHLEILYEINARFLALANDRLGRDDARARRLSLIDEDGERRVRMAHLAIVGSHAVNGVAALHTEILKTRVFPEFHRLWPAKFSNKTNGITQRRWLLKCNPELSDVISSVVGTGWITDLCRLEALISLAGDAAFGQRWRQAKRQRKVELAAVIEGQYQRRGQPLQVDPDALFDVHVKRIHEYKRQLLNVLHVITLYNRIKDGVAGDALPRTVIFGGKAAPGYAMAKLLIRLINAVGSVVNGDRDARDHLKVVFLADYRVSLAQQIVPAADLSEQISTAGTEASGTSNMKLALNGALTIGTLDGANVEIRDAVGEDNVFIFGLTAEEATALASRYDPWDHYRSDAGLRRALDMIRTGAFNREAPDLFAPIVRSLLEEGDRYLVLADYPAYVACQDRVARAYRDPIAWTRKSIMNTARMGDFSSDRTVRQYAEDIWGVAPVPVPEATDAAS